MIAKKGLSGRDRTQSAEMKRKTRTIGDCFAPIGAGSIHFADRDPRPSLLLCLGYHVSPRLGLAIADRFENEARKR
jgi:hypothetical protein